jgi:hypothetical protein
MNAVTPGWFATYGVHLKSGRDVSDHDRAGGPPVAVVDETFARRFFPNVDPVGRHIDRRVPPNGKESVEIVGVVENTVYSSLRSEPAPAMYVPLAQSDEKDTEIALTVRAAGGSQAQLSRALATSLLNVDGAVGLTFRPLSDQLGASLRQERLVAMLAGFFGALALVLSGLGLYGVTAYAVGRRRAEIGIRLALGSTRAAIVRLALQRDRLADRVGRAAKPLLPEVVADHRHGAVRTAAAYVIDARERTADERLDAEDVEEPAARERAVRELALAAHRQVEARAGPGERAVEQLVLPIADLFPDRIRPRAAVDLDQALGFVHGQRLVDEAVEDREQRGIGAHAERE